MARCGGDEMAVILPESDLQSALLAAERIRKTIEEHPFTGSIRISVSIGVAEGSGEASGKDEILKKADEALYRAKEKGRNCVST